MKREPIQGRRTPSAMRRATGAALASMALAATAGAQELPTDRSLTASLLAVSMPAPFGAAWMDRGFPDTAQGGTRVDLSWGSATRAIDGGWRRTAIIGIRTEKMERFSGPIADGRAGGPVSDSASSDTIRAGGRMRGSGGGSGIASYAGARLGVHADSQWTHQPISAFELYAGGRSYGFGNRPYLPDVGLDLTIGWGGFGENTRASLALRMPVEMVVRVRGARAILFAAPAVAWGHIRSVDCTDSDPYDDDQECSFFGRDIAFGLPRFIMAGGMTVAAERARLALTVGMQRLSSPGEAARIWVGTSWTP